MCFIACTAVSCNQITRIPSNIPDNSRLPAGPASYVLTQWIWRLLTMTKPYNMLHLQHVRLTGLYLIAGASWRVRTAAVYQSTCMSVSSLCIYSKALEPSKGDPWWPRNWMKTKRVHLFMRTPTADFMLPFLFEWKKVVISLKFITLNNIIVVVQQSLKADVCHLE